MEKILLLTFIMLLMIGCTGNNKQSLKEKIEVIDAFSKDQESTEQQTEPIKTTEPTKESEPIKETADQPDPLKFEGQTVESIMENMTLEEKVAQLFIVDFLSFNKNSEVTEMTTALKDRLSHYPVGGVIFFSRNIIDTAQVTTLINQLQESTYLPLFVSIDEEGGRISRLQKDPEMGMTITPAASIIGDTNDSQNAYKVGNIMGEELNALGFNMDFAPVADVNTNSDNTVIGDRAFSSDPNIVGDMVVQEAKGLQEQNVAAFAKHFPGHGDTSTDTHIGSVSVDHDRQRLDQIELVPFQQAIDNNIMGIMVAHIALPNITGTMEPASLSHEMISKILREDMHYNGLVITDALDMKAISENYTSDEACVKALQAGADLLLMPDNFELGYNGVLKALSNGTLTEARINESLERILNAKMSLGLLNSSEQRQPLSIIGSQEHKDIMNTILE